MPGNDPGLRTKPTSAKIPAARHEIRRRFARGARAPPLPSFPVVIFLRPVSTPSSRPHQPTRTSPASPPRHPPVVAAAWGAARCRATRLRMMRTGGLAAPVVGIRCRRAPLSMRCDASLRDGRRQDCWGHNALETNYRPMLYTPHRYRSMGFRSFALPVPLKEIPLIKSTSLALTRSCDTLLANSATSLVVSAIGIIVFALWGFLPLMRDISNRFDHGGNWKKSPTYLISTSYLQPLLLWTGATLICRCLDPVVMPSAASQAVKIRLVTFVRSLSTVLAVAYILTRYLKPTLFANSSFIDPTMLL